MWQDLIDHLRNRKILIWGFGREGHSSYTFLRRHLPRQSLAVADAQSVELERDAALTIYSETEVMERGAEFDLILKAPGIATRHLDLGAMRGKITGQADLFLQFAPGTIIGVTGTKGKSTTSALLAHLLRQAEREVFLAGNIGLPLWDIIEKLGPETITVAELSSYQLEFARHSPSLVLWLNLYQEHLNFHGTFPAYAEAKRNIMRFQKTGDTLIFHEAIAGELAALSAQVQRVAVSPRAEVPFDLRGHASLRGAHNRLNAFFAVQAARQCGVKAEEMAAGLASFQGLPHRLECVGTFGGVTYYNDSISTVPESALAALEALPETETFIVGGQNRGVSYEKLSQFLAQSTLRTIILLPETGAWIGEWIEKFNLKKGGPELHHVMDLAAAVRLAQATTRRGGLCLFSPAAPSYHVYKNFAERGESFKRLVQT